MKAKKARAPRAPRTPRQREDEIQDGAITSTVAYAALLQAGFECGGRPHPGIPRSIVIHILRHSLIVLYRWEALEEDVCEEVLSIVADACVGKQTKNRKKAEAAMRESLLAGLMETQGRV